MQKWILFLDMKNLYVLILSIPDGFTPPVRSWKPVIPV